MSTTVEWIKEHRGETVATVGEEPQGTVYICPGGIWQSGDVSGSLLLDTGEAPWGHMSSSIAWLIRDLTTGFTDRRERLEALYPNGYRVVLASADGDIPAEVLERNKAWAASSEGDAAEVSA